MNSTQSVFVTFFLVLFFLTPVEAKKLRFGEKLCQQKEFQCRGVVKGDSWNSLWPEPAEQDIIKRINRMNIALQPGMILAVPNALTGMTKVDFAPFPKTRATDAQKVVVVDLSQLAWGAYDEGGRLIAWGPASGGKDYCPDTRHACQTPAGEYVFQWKRGEACKSRKVPIPQGGAPMPYCLFFYDGAAIHGSSDVPGYNASHGCVRVFTADAKWLNEEFVVLTGPMSLRTRIIVLPYDEKSATSPTGGH